MLIQDGYRRWQHRSNAKEVRVVNGQTRNEERLAFKSGVDQVFARNLRLKLMNKDFAQEVKPTQILRSDGQRNRWEVVSDGKGGMLVKMSERKKAFHRDDIALLAHDYDIRLDGATEEPIVGDPPKMDVWEQERRKKRVTYTSNEFKAWQLDLTSVETVQGGDNARGMKI